MTLVLTQNRKKVQRFRVGVVRGPDAGASCESSGLDLTVGTSAGNDLELHDPSVSRHQFALAASDQGVALTDLGSTNGTVVDGVRVISGFVSSGSTIAVGETLLSFEVLDDLVEPLISDADHFGFAIGSSTAMRRVFALLERAATSDATIVLEGETGTGKTLLAEAVHAASPRADGPFVVVDCAAIPRSLMEAELFGHARAAFDGAGTTGTGLLRAAHGGTLFLDEVADLPGELQPKLLRALDRGAVMPIGSDEEHPIDVRIVAATERDLRREVNAGRFRPDLWYRLNTVRIRVPALRERREDVPRLVEHFFHQLAGDDTAPLPGEVVDELVRGEWPGNVRELHNAVERAILFPNPRAWRDELEPDKNPLEATFDPAVPFRTAKLRATNAWEKRYLAELMRVSGGRLTDAARAARMDRSYLRELLRRHHLHGT